MKEVTLILKVKMTNKCYESMKGKKVKERIKSGVFQKDALSKTKGLKTVEASMKVKKVK